MSQVRWIITKDALKEGWDCSFAYILALLDNTKTKTTVTQIVGRVMRQPHARTIEKFDALNRCYIYCFNRDVGDTVEWVKSGLESEGLTGLSEPITGSEGGVNTMTRTIRRRKPYKKLDIFLPQVLHKEGRKWRPIDYDRDILGSLNWAGMKAGDAVNLDDKDIIAERLVAVDIHGENFIPKTEVDTGESLTLDYFVRRLTGVVPNPWQAARIAGAFIQSHRRKGHDDAKLLKNRIFLLDVLRRNAKKAVDDNAERVFRNKIRQNEIRFHLVTDEKLNYEFHKTLEITVAEGETPLSQHGTPVQRSLFEDAFESRFNPLEKDFALYLEESDAIYWWHRIAARQAYSLQGWRRYRVYPDFVAYRKGNGKLYILETKGDQLSKNPDTTYKKKLLSTLEETYKDALDRGTMKVEEPDAVFRMMFKNNWKEGMNALVSD